MLSNAIGRGGKLILGGIVKILSRYRVNPNILTFTGVLISVWAAFYFSYGAFFQAGLVIIFAGLFDMLDGEVARLTRSVTEFGAFYDSVIDRYSDVIILQGLMVWYARQNMLGYVVLVGVVFMGAVLTSYDLPEYRQAALHFGADRFFVKDSLKWEEVAALAESVRPDYFPRSSPGPG